MGGLESKLNKEGREAAVRTDMKRRKKRGKVGQEKEDKWRLDCVQSFGFIQKVKVPVMIH